MSTIHLRTLTDQPLEATLDRLHLNDDDDTITAHLILAWPAWLQVKALSLFHLDGEPDPLGFEPDQNVSISARLRAPIPHPDGLEQLAAALLDPASPLSHTEAWLATAVLQTVDVPEGNAELGIRTRWADPIIPPASAPAPNLQATLTAFLEGAGFAFEQPKPDMFRFKAIVDEIRQWIVLVRLDEEKRTYTFYSVHPDSVPLAEQPRMALTIASANYELGVGTFEMDPTDGELRYRTPVAEASAEALGNALRANLTHMARLFQTAREISQGV